MDEYQTSVYKWQLEDWLKYFQRANRASAKLGQPILDFKDKESVEEQILSTMSYERDPNKNEEAKAKIFATGLANL